MLRIDLLPGLMDSLHRWVCDSMRGKQPDSPLFSCVVQLDQENEESMVFIAVKCQRGRNFSSAYSDRKVIEMVDVAGVFEVRTSAYKHLLKRERKAQQRAKKKVLIEAIKRQEHEFDEQTRKATTIIPDLNPAMLTDEELDALDLIDLEVRAGSLIKD